MTTLFQFLLVLPSKRRNKKKKFQLHQSSLDTFKTVIV